MNGYTLHQLHLHHHRQQRWAGDERHADIAGEPHVTLDAVPGGLQANPLATMLRRTCAPTEFSRRLAPITATDAGVNRCRKLATSA